MSRLFYHVMQDNVGNLLFDVSGTMRVAGSATLATIYGDEALTVILPNPMTNHPSFGSFKCFLGAGDYDFHMAKAGYTFETLTGVQGHGTMAQQDANAVAITGGDATLHHLGVNTAPDPTYPLAINGQVIQSGGGARFLDTVAIRGAPIVDVELAIFQQRGSNHHGLVIRAVGNDTGGSAALFSNVAGTVVGSITMTGAATAYNTSSDGRLKEAIAPLPDALATVQALQPVTFTWKHDGTPGQGFIAQDVQALVPQAVTGTPDSLAPTMQLDFSKLIPHLVGAVQALSHQVETLSARLAAVEGS